MKTPSRARKAQSEAAACAALGLQQDGLRVRLAVHRPEERAPSGEGA